MKLAYLAPAAAIALLAAPTAQAADPVMGDWLTVGGGAKVRVAPCPADSAKACGTITWMKNPKDKAGGPQKDTNNPDPALRARPVLGLQLIRDFKPAGPGKWTGGKIYDPGSGKTYGSKLAANPNGTLKVEGCIGPICQAQTWTR
ncbi:MAG: DUF2147 domain-containing protein [Phenylobacterium sp.]|uniref:DUF2147 domain-containing protein n=1 Tax=Phenylobacterium sp. TaxID=1871053 RepID=UPI001B63DCDA|nr:DUF2147 domain-containing protein [Phenylobacterium sp.]MBP7815384.1 DUF2147 domain-containing protein [Phenylobacterium sp.]MBP9230310.1 DUF2147 domain-containing protein [Phenylobacterium sp.]MBP9754900.1 DUF2147 domain-containing protein [Phenylobacterium sp.]